MEKFEASIAIQVLPKVEGDSKLITVVDKVITYIKSFKLNTFVSPFETTIEGDLDTLMEIIKECQKICIREGAASVMSYIKIAYNPKMGVLSIDQKVGKHNK